jgi:hypothetical protein
MTRVRHKGKTMLLITLALGCLALVFLWPQWRNELRAQESEPEEEAVTPVTTVCLCRCSPSPPGNPVQCYDDDAFKSDDACRLKSSRSNCGDSKAPTDSFVINCGTCDVPKKDNPCESIPKQILMRCTGEAG